MNVLFRLAIGGFLFSLNVDMSVSEMVMYAILIVDSGVYACVSVGGSASSADEISYGGGHGGESWT